MNAVDLVFGWIIGASIRASFLSVIIISLQYFLRRWLTPRWRYALWLPFLFVLIAPVLPPGPVPVVQLTGFGVVEGVEDTEVSDDGKVVPISDKTVATIAVPPPTIDGLPGLDLLSMAWLMGFISVVGMGLFGYQRTIRRIKDPAIAPPQSLIDAVSLAAKQISLSHVPQVIVSPAVESPAVTGLFRPILLLPAQFPEGLNDSEVRLVLTHELLHLKRRDLPLNWLFSLLLALHWFNPLLWRAFRKIRADREEDCDAQVLAAQSTDSRADYGNALIKMESTTLKTGLSLGFVGIFARSGLRARIVAIGRHRRGHPAWALLGVAVIVLLTLGGATTAPSPALTPTITPSPARAQADPNMIQVEMTIFAFPKGKQATLTADAITDNNGVISCVNSNVEADAMIKKLVADGGTLLNMTSGFVEPNHQQMVGADAKQLIEEQKTADGPIQRFSHINLTAFPQLSEGGLNVAINFEKQTDPPPNGVGKPLDPVLSNQGGSMVLLKSDQTGVLAVSNFQDVSGRNLIFFVKAHFLNPVTFPPPSNNLSILVANIKRIANAPNAMIRVKYDYSIFNGVVTESKPVKIYVWDSDAQHAQVLKTARIYCDDVIDMSGKK